MDTTRALSKGWGDGWLSNNAMDLMQIQILFTDIDRDAFILRVIRAGHSNRITNVATVEKVLAEMTAEFDNE